MSWRRLLRFTLMLALLAGAAPLCRAELPADPEQRAIFLARVLDSPDADMWDRIRACTLLEKLGPDALCAAPSLVDALRYDMLRSHAVEALVAIGPRAVPAIRSAMNPMNPEVFHINAMAWAAIDAKRGVAVNELFARLALGDLKASYEAALVLACTGPPADVIPVLARASASDWSPLGHAAAEMGVHIAAARIIDGKPVAPLLVLENWRFEPPTDPPGALVHAPEGAPWAADANRGAHWPDGVLENLPPARENPLAAVFAKKEYRERTLKELIEAAKTGSNDDRIAALNEISGYQTTAAECAGELRKILDDPCADVARAAAGALYGIGLAAVPQLLDALQSHDGFTRRLALSQLADLPLNKYADREILLKNLPRSLNESDPLLRRPAAMAYCMLWPQCEPLLTRAMKAGDEVVKRAVVDQFLETGGNFSHTAPIDFQPNTDDRVDETFAAFEEQVAPDLLKRMNLAIDRERERERAFDVLHAFRSSQSRRRLAEFLVGDLSDDKASIYHYAEDKLKLLGPEAVPALFAGTMSVDWWARGACVKELERRGAHVITDERSVAAVMSGLDNPSSAVRGVAVAWAVQFPRPVPGLVGKLAAMLTPDNILLYVNDARDRRAIVDALGRFGTEPKICVPALLGLLDRAENRDVTSAAIIALGKFGQDAKAALPRLRELLKTNDTDLAHAAVDTLSVLGPEGRQAAVPFLTGTLAHTLDPETRLWAVRALAAIGSESADAVPTLIALLSDTDNGLRIEVARALGAIGPKSRPAFPALTRMVDNRDPEVRQAASDALIRIAPTGTGLGPALIAAVMNRDRVCADQLAAVMQRSGEARAMEIRLTDLAGADPDTGVRATARRAVEFLSSK